jgi:hypothetical protein
MLRAVPKHWFSWDFTVVDASDQTVATVDMSAWREKATVVLADTTYQIRRDGMIGPFLLEDATGVVARAVKPSAFRQSFIVEYAGREYTLTRRSAFTREAVLRLDAQEVGSIGPEAWFTRRAAVNITADVPVAVEVFLLVLVLFLWKRESNAAAASAGAG